MHVCFYCACFSFSVISQKIAWEERLRNELFSVEWDIKPQLNQPLYYIIEHPTWTWLFFLTSDPSCTDPMPIYAQLTKGRNLFAGQSSSHAQDESSLDGPPNRRSGDSKVAWVLFFVPSFFHRTVYLGWPAFTFFVLMTIFPN